MRIDLSPGDDVAAAVRGAVGGSVVVVIARGADPLHLAMTRAAIGPLAIERAPAMRVNAIVPAADADQTNVAAAVAFLDRARSTTGQVLEVS